MLVCHTARTTCGFKSQTGFKTLSVLTDTVSDNKSLLKAHTLLESKSLLDSVHIFVHGNS